jgi:hypothetical protein
MINWPVLLEPSSDSLPPQIGRGIADRTQLVLERLKDPYAAFNPDVMKSSDGLIVAGAVEKGVL